MERRKKRIKDNVGSYKEYCECESACTNGYKAYFGVQILRKFLKESSEKRKTAVFALIRLRNTAVFSVFKSVKLLDKIRRNQNLSVAGALSKVKVSFYARII